MRELVVQIDRLVDEHQPGFVECSFLDALGRRHVFIEKVPVVTTEDLWVDSQYPLQGAIACQVQREWREADARALAQVSTKLPWGVESTSGESSFVVLATQLRSQPPS